MEVDASPKKFRETASTDGQHVTWEWVTRGGQTGRLRENAAPRNQVSENLLDGRGVAARDLPQCGHHVRTILPVIKCLMLRAS
jgi:hypothetical protein